MKFLRELRNLIIALVVFALCLGYAGHTFDFGWIRPHSKVTVRMDAGRAAGTLHPGSYDLRGANVASPPLELVDDCIFEWHFVSCHEG